MKDIRMKQRLVDLFYSAMLAGELTLLADLVLVLLGRAQSVLKFAAILAGFFLVLCLVPGRWRRIKKTAALGICAVTLVTGATAWLCWNSVSKSSVYACEDQGKQHISAG